MDDEDDCCCDEWMDVDDASVSVEATEARTDSE